MRIFFGSGILLLLFFKSMILKKYICLEKGLQKLENTWEQETTLTFSFKKKKKLLVVLHVQC